SMMAVRVARSCAAAWRLRSDKLARQIVCPVGDRACSQTYNHVARPRQLADQPDKIPRIGEGSCIAMTVLDQPGDEGISCYPFDRSLAGGVDIRDQDDIGIVEACAKAIEEVQHAGEAMRLN